MAWARGILAILAMAGLTVAASLFFQGTSVQAQHQLTYVAIGASDAVGIGAADPLTQGWVPLFGARLGPNTRVVNLGVSGSTLAQALEEQLGPALDAHPDVVTVWLAVNDLNAGVSLDTYAADLDSLLGQLEATHARVLVGNVPNLRPLAVYRGIDPAQLEAEVDRWNAAIADTSARHGATLVDLYGRWQEVAQHPEYISADGFHPSTDGYARLAEVFGEALDAPS
jgi:lysophospholipase L1-like esterase